MAGLFVIYGTHYTSYRWQASSRPGRQEGFEKPIFAWLLSVAVPNLTQTKHFHPRWEGGLLIASFKGGSVFRLRYEEGVVRYSEPIWFSSRNRDISETSDARVVLWTDQGELIFLLVDDKIVNADKRQEAAVSEPGSISCLACYHVGAPNGTHAALSLSKISGRKIASDNFPHYSNGLKSQDGTWTDQNLRDFLLNPNDFAGGTKMIIGDMTLSQVDPAVKFFKTLD